MDIFFEQIPSSARAIAPSPRSTETKRELLLTTALANQPDPMTEGCSLAFKSTPKSTKRRSRESGCRRHCPLRAPPFGLLARQHLDPAVAPFVTFDGIYSPIES